MKTDRTVISSQSDFFLLFKSRSISQIVSIASLFFPVHGTDFPPEVFDEPVNNEKGMSGINAIAEKCNFEEKANGQDDACSNANSDEYPDDAFRDSLFIFFHFDGEVHFLFDVCGVIGGIGLFIDNLLGDWA